MYAVSCKHYNIDFTSYFSTLYDYCYSVLGPFSAVFISFHLRGAERLIWGNICDGEQNICREFANINTTSNPLEAEMVATRQRFLPWLREQTQIFEFFCHCVLIIGLFYTQVQNPIIINSQHLTRHAAIISF